MTRTNMPPPRRAAMQRDIDKGLERLGMQLALARGARARDRILAEIDELRRQKAALACP